VCCLTLWPRGVEMLLMPRITVVMATAATSLVFACAQALAQGVAPGGPIYNSTAMGSGLGGTNGTGPSWPNGSNQAPQPSITPPAIGGGGGSSATPAPVTSSIAPSSTYRQPHTAATPRPPAIEPLHLPFQTAADLSFLRGCWRTDIFQHERLNGLSTWCLDGKGSGKVMYTRIDQPSFYCHAAATASYTVRQLHLHSQAWTCSDGSALALGDLDCQQSPAGVARCVGGPTTPGEIAVGLYRVR